MSRYRLSKSRILSGLQCFKRLWLEVHRPELVTYSSATQRLFQVGHSVGEVARALRPGGLLIDPPDLGRAIADTQAALAAPGDLTLFEATLRHGGVLVRADVLERRRGEYRMVEVKSSTSVKPYHINDAAVQAWVCAGAGVPVSSTAIAHIDNTFVYGGDGAYDGLLREVDVTAEVDALARYVPVWVSDMQAMLDGPMPTVEAGRCCSEPFSCPLVGFCADGRPEYHVSLLPHGAKVAAALLAAGYDDLTAVPGDWPLDRDQKRVWQATVSGQAELDPAARALMLGLPRPRFFLDFETISFGVPVWAGTRPYRQLPFQWSLHVECEGGGLEHREFLDTSGEPPMRACAESLLEALGDAGPILVYTGFERARIDELAARFPDLAPALRAAAARLVDLHPIVREHYYHPAMMGSWSLKAVLPTIAPDLDYAQLDEVRDGEMAQTAYLEAISPQTAPERRAALRESLLRYCEVDTLAMVRLARFLEDRTTPTA
jgi:hypothetical protein